MGTQRKLICIASSLLCVASLVVAFLLGLHYWQDRYDVMQQAKERARIEIGRVAQEIDIALRKLMPLTTAIADDLSAGGVPKEQLLNRLRTTMETNPELLGIGVAYAPLAYDPEIRLYAPYYVKKEEELQLVHVDSFYDYTEPDYTWYHEPLANGPGWIEPRFGEVVDALMVEFAVPFYRLDAGGQEKIPAGVIHTSVSVDDIKETIDSLELGENGYGFLLSKKGAFLAHPLVEEYVRGHKTIFDVAEARHDTVLRSMGERAIRGERGMIEDAVAATGQAMWLFYEPIPSTGWSLGGVFFTDQLATHTKPFQRQLIRVALVCMAFLFFLAILLISLLHKGGITLLWWAVVSTSVIWLAAIVFVWYVTFTAPLENTFGIVPFTKASLDKFIVANTRSALKRTMELPIHVPTGVFIQTLEFVGSNNVHMTGYIWQRYSNAIPPQVSRGFILPETVTADITEAYRRVQENEEIRGWYVKATFRERFDYTQYPFDQQIFWIRLWHKDFYKNVVLIPDFDSYKLANRNSRPGMEEDFILPGWTIERTFFGYTASSYDVNFGLRDYVGTEGFPELYFNVILKRNIVNPFFSNLLPIVVAAIMVFGLLIINSKRSEQVGILGFSSTSVLGGCAALFFAILLAQLDLRGKLSTESILYIEYFYFVMYCTILTVTFNAILFGLTDRIWLIEYDDNLIPKLVYWPVMLGIVLAITLFIFY